MAIPLFKQEAPEPGPPAGGFLGIGLLVGLLVGTIMGVLMAPASGRITRNRLKRRAEAVRDQVLESADEVEEAGQNLISSAEQRVRKTRAAVRRRLRGEGSG